MKNLYSLKAEKDILEKSYKLEYYLGGDVKTNNIHLEYMNSDSLKVE